MKFFIFLFGITVFIAGCTTTPPQKSKFTPAVAKSLLKKGVTTQAQVLSVWGFSQYGDSQFQRQGSLDLQ